ncbi:MAG TPA: hypothetical protein VF587_16720 [Solirubrobacteraceae bacterium]|jgi:putative GTP pyrophosphokinase
MSLTKAAIREVYDAEIKAYTRATNRLKELLEVLVQDLSDRYGVREGVQITGEPKGFESFYKKVKERKVKKAELCCDAVRDFARARVVVQTIDDVYRLIDLLEHQETVVPYPETVQDYIENPQERGYRSYHVDVGVDIPREGKTETVRCELQIRTTIQDAWGGFSHKDFYKGKAIPAVYEEQMQEMSALLACVDRMAASLIRNLDAEEAKTARARPKTQHKKSTATAPKKRPRAPAKAVTPASSPGAASRRGSRVNRPK